MKIISDYKSIKKVICDKKMDAILPEALFEYGEILKLEANEHVLDANIPMDYFYFFIEGRLKIFQIHENGRAILIQFYDRFNSLGDIEVMTDVLCTCSVSTVKPTLLMRFPMWAVRQHALEHPPFLKYIIKSLAEKLVTSERHHSYNLIYPVKNRLASYLKAYVDQNEEIRLFHTLQDVSELIGTTYRQVHRAFQSLEDEGILLKEGKVIRILNREKLEALAGHIYQLM